MSNQVDTFANRLKIAMRKNNITATELSKKTKIDKSSISNYLSGKYKANSDNLSTLAETLNVTEPWLMGYDIINTFTAINDKDFDKFNAIFKNLINNLSDSQADEVLNYIYYIQSKEANNKK